jgi:coproporphyrinogen III oxidase
MNPTQSLDVFFQDLQAQIVSAFGTHEPKASFQKDPWTRESLGQGVSIVIEEGEVLEKGGVNYSSVKGVALPESATLKRPELRHKPFTAMGVSVVIHPRNPYIPTSHFNVRLIRVEDCFWVGGGFDLTPYYGFEADCILWHQQAKAACDRHDPSFYPHFKKNCDDYFYLKHRQEARGIGGIFFDDLTLPLAKALSFLTDVTNAYIEAYTAILARRKGIHYTERERQFQARRRGRYVEFNLLYDRGTLFGLQSGGRTESILMSLPPNVSWKYKDLPENLPEEQALYTQFLPPRDWLK